ncbi:MAG TPA: alpha/beta hydrolase, partial [Mycobacterium sp.]|nr:alpha/beta hydrolase [Mycobacterium sp.]
MRQAAVAGRRRPLGGKWASGWLAGAAGLAAVGSVAGATVAHSMTRRTTAEDPYADEDFEILDSDRSSVVTTDDGVQLAVRDVGPLDAPLTVVFAHGFCLRMGSFHFQRARLTQEWGRQVRMVFYDQRGHGASEIAPPDTYTVPRLGQDLEAVLAAAAPRGPVVLVGHSMGGMTIMALAELYPEMFVDQIRGVVFISTSAGKLDEVTFGMPDFLARFSRPLVPVITGAGRL